MIFHFPADPAGILAAHNPRLVISEVHPNAGADGTSFESHEWVELHNLEEHPVSLRGWTIEDAQAIARLPDYDLPAGAAVLIVGDASQITVSAGETLIKLQTRRLGSGLRNAGDRVALVDPYGVRHDAVSWGDVINPRYIDKPQPGQSIVRTRTGGQTLSNKLTPWRVDEEVNANPDQYKHPRPDTIVRITSALVTPVGDEPESITVTNISDRPVLTVNWTLTVGSALVRLRSARIEPRESHTFVGADGRLGGGLKQSGGHLVLRDPRGNWLATASWGSDETFHRLPVGSPGEEVHFSRFARVHPRIPWFESIDYGNRTVVRDAQLGRALTFTDAIANENRQREPEQTRQESLSAGVWISEVYPTAGQGRADPQYEWFELTNSTDQAIDLTGWSIADNTASDVLDGLVIPPGESVVVGTSTLAGEDVVAAITDGRIGNGLANAGDQLRLINPASEVVDAVSWGNDRDFTTIKAPKVDESIHRSSPEAAPTIAPPSPGSVARPVVSEPPAPAENEPAARTPSSGSEGTETAGADSASSESSSSESPAPQRVEGNQQPTPARPPAEVPRAPPALRITEILPAPLAGQPEWVELHNPGDDAVNLEGWSIGDAEGKTPLSGMIAANGRTVIATGDLDAEGLVVLVDRIGNGLNNDGDTVYIYDADDQIVHQVRYGEDELPAPDRGLSIALEPQRWVVTALPTPGEAGVTPLLDDSLRSASVRQPVSDQERLPVVQMTQDDDSDAWMIVSFALIGVILTLVIRRWRPDDPAPTKAAEPATYSGTSQSPAAAEDSEPREGRPGR